MKKLYISLLIAILISGCASRETLSTPASESSKTDTDVALTDKANLNLYETHIVGTLPPGLSLETIPGEYGPDFVTYVVQPSRVEYVPSATQYKWVEGEVKGFEETYIPYEISVSTTTETLIFKEAYAELVMRPPDYNKDGSLARPATVIERIIPAITKNVDRRVIRDPAGPTTSRITPYEYKNGKTRVPIKPSKTIEKFYPAITKQIEVRKLIRPPSYIIRDESGQIVHRFETGTEVVAFLKSSKTH